MSAFEDPAFREALHREFPASAAWWLQPVNRRRFVQLMGAALALAGLGSTGCIRTPPEDNLPAVTARDETEPVFFATAIRLGGATRGVLARCIGGRPVKLEGNPEHPASLGATDALTQADLLTLYDPERSQTVLRQGQPADWPSFQAALQAAVAGGGLRLLTEPVTSPTLRAQLAAFLQAHPDARWHVWDPLGDAAAFAAQQATFGRPADLVCRFERAQVVVSLDCDFLADPAAGVRYARDLMARRRAPEAGRMGRLYVVESGHSLTGAAADRRLAARPSDIAAVATDIARGLLEGPQVVEGIAAEAARDLLQARGEALVLAGPTQPAAVHALTAALNGHLGSFGHTLTAVPRIDGLDAPALDSLSALVDDMRAGRVPALVVIGANPLYTAPADLGFADAVKRVQQTMHVGLYLDETARACAWHAPLQHDLETWSDGVAFDGTASLLQPVVSPLYGGHSAHEVLACMNGERGLSAREAVRRHWRLDDAGWRRALQRGVVEGASVDLLDAVNVPALSTATGIERTTGGEGLELVFRADAAVHDGRYANNAWLQELPRPLTQLTWDNAFLISPGTAAALGVQSGDVVDAGGVRGPVYVLRGHADGCATVALGYGRKAAGSVGNGVGFDAYPLRTSDALAVRRGVTLQPVRGARHALALRQRHDSQEGRDLLRLASLARYLRTPDFASREAPSPPSLYPPFDYATDENGAPRHKWGMVIDLTACIGCSACVVACQAENNIPSVGRAEVLRQHEMHWLRIDRWFDGDQASFQPVPCMHRENAPCEVVCPVGATVHSDEGLNEMVYNRCVGTRYCSNNCPYKVRRFNWFDYTGGDQGTPLELVHNPEVTVRPRGVMEKCTYCVQRIEQSRIRAAEEERPVRDGEVVTACQQSCPTSAIVFGDLNDEQSAVSRAAASPRRYRMLGELNTQPRTTYLARIVNPPEAGT